MAGERTLKITILGDAKQAVQAMKDTSESAGGLMSKLGVAVAGGAVAIGGALAGIGVGAFKLGGEFDDAYDTIRIGTGATGEDLEGLEQSFRNVAGSVPASFGDIGTAIADINTRMGASGEQVEGLATQFLNLGRITGEDVPTLIADGSRALADWGVSNDDAGQSLDFLFKVAQSTGIGVDELMQKVSQSGAPMREMGLDFETSATLLGQMEKAGVNSEQAISGLNRAVASAAREGKPAAQAIQETFDTIKNAKDPTEATQLAVELFGTKAGPELASAIRSGRLDVADLTQTLRDSGESINGVADETADFAEKWQTFTNQAKIAAEPLANTVFNLAGSILDKLGPIITAFVAEAGPKLEEIFTSIGNWINDNALPVLQSFGDWFVTTGMPAITTFISGAWDLLSSAFTTVKDSLVNDILPALDQMRGFFEDKILPAIQAFAGQVQPLIQPVLDFLQNNFMVVIGVVAAAVAVGFAAWAISAGAAAVATIAAMAPILVPIAAIALAVALLKTAWESNWGGIQDKLKVVWGVIQPVIQGIYDHLAKFWTEIQPKLLAAWENVKAAIETVVNAIKVVITTVFDAIMGFIQEHGDEIKTILSTAWDAIKVVVETVIGVIEGIIKTVLDLISGDWGAAWDDIKGIAQTVWDGIKQLVEDAITIVKTTLGLVLGEIKDAWDSVWDKVKQKVSDIWEGVKQIVRDGIQAVKDFFVGAPSWLLQAGKDIIQGLIDGIQSLHIPLPHVSVSTHNVGVGPLSVPVPDFSVSWYRQGGVFARPSIIGVAEAGPEAVLPLSGAGLEKVRAALASANGGPTISIHIDQVIASDRAAAERAAGDLAYGVMAQLRARGVA